MPHPTQEQIDRFFPIVNNPTKFQAVCYDAETRSKADPSLVKVRKPHAKPGDTAAMQALKNDPTPSIIFNDGRMFALAKGVIGEGAFGRVKLLLEIKKDPETGQYGYGDIYVLKIEKKNDLNQQREFAITQSLGHIVGTKLRRDVNKTDDQGKQYTDKYYTQQVFLGHSLDTYVKSLPTTSPERLSLAIQLCQQVDELHEKHKIAHQDIKLDNSTILDGQVHLIDFGLATELTKKLGSLRGTPIYLLGAETQMSIQSVKAHLSDLNSEEKDILALKRTMVLPDNIKKVYPKEFYFLTPDMLKDFPPKLLDIIRNDNLNECIARKNDKPLMIAAQLVLQLYFAGENIKVRNTLIDFIMNADRKTLQEILAIHDGSLPLNEKSEKLKTYLAPIMLNEFQTPQTQIQPLKNENPLPLENAKEMTSQQPPLKDDKKDFMANRKATMSEYNKVCKEIAVLLDDIKNSSVSNRPTVIQYLTTIQKEYNDLLKVVSDEKNNKINANVYKHLSLMSETLPKLALLKANITEWKKEPAFTDHSDSLNQFKTFSDSAPRTLIFDESNKTQSQSRSTDYKQAVDKMRQEADSTRPDPSNTKPTHQP